MKWLIYILLLVNLGVFVWHYQPGEAGRQTTLSSEHTRLVLLKEYEQRLSSVADSDGISRCYSLGPFTNKPYFVQAKERFQKQGVDTFSRVSSEQVRNGYWVMLPVSSSSNQAKVLIQKLKEKGVKDYFLVATGEMKNAISLGVFSKAKLAKRRRDELEKQGFKVNIKKITLPKRVYWLEWPRNAIKQPGHELLDELRARYRGIGQTERLCMSDKKS